MALIDFTDKGLYCAVGDFFIDPWKPVRKAVITHAHSDHAKLVAVLICVMLRASPYYNCGLR